MNTENMALAPGEAIEIIRKSPSDAFRKAATEMEAKAEETSYCDLYEIYLENAKLFKIAAEAIDAAELEVSVLRTELAGANARAHENAACARSWFDRHEALLGKINPKAA